MEQWPKLPIAIRLALRPIFPRQSTGAMELLPVVLLRSKMASFLSVDQKLTRHSVVFQSESLLQVLVTNRRQFPDQFLSQMQLQYSLQFLTNP